MSSALVIRGASTTSKSDHFKDYSWVEGADEAITIESTDVDFDWHLSNWDDDDVDWEIEDFETPKRSYDPIIDEPFEVFEVEIVSSTATSDGNVQPLLELRGGLVSSERDFLLAQVRAYELFEDGWDGPDSFAAKEGVVEDALTVLQYWPVALELPEPGLCVDGNIVLEVYDEDGLSNGGIELIGDHVGIYSVVHGEETILVDRFNALSSTELLFALAAMKNELS